MPYAEVPAFMVRVRNAYRDRIVRRRALQRAGVGCPTAGFLADWTPPANVSTAFIFGDNDASATGQAAAYGLARRLKAKGIAVEVQIPNRTDSDWNDVLRSKRPRQ